MPNHKVETRRQILVVDDDVLICELLAEVLADEGYQPILCTDPYNALDISEKRSFDLAFVDINLPEMNGLDLATRLKEDNWQREVVFITGSGKIENAVQAIKIGAYDYLRKPFSIGELKMCLKRFEQRRALQDKIKQAEQRYCNLVENIPLLIYILRSNLELEFVNQSCESILGYIPEEALNDPNWFMERIHPDERPRMSGLLEEAFRGGSTHFSTECRMLHKKGHPVDTIVRSLPSRVHAADRTEKVERLEGIIVDITDRVFLEKALVQREKLKTLGAISAEVAHEIRNPLVSIGGFARRLQKKNPDLFEAEIILNEAARLEKILDRIRDYLRPVELRWQDCSINEIIRSCLRLLSPEIEARGILYRLDTDPSQPLTAADRDALSQTFINLIRNAMEAMRRGEELTIRSYESERSVHVDFRNPTGRRKTTISEQLFLPFDEGGQTIGLPLCYRLIKSLGGILSCTQEESEIVFTISLPKRGLDELPLSGPSDRLFPGSGPVEGEDRVTTRRSPVAIKTELA